MGTAARLVPLLALAASAACVVGVELDDKRCDGAHRCASGYYCVEGFCQTEPGADAGAPQQDAGTPTDAGLPPADAGSGPGVDGGAAADAGQVETDGGESDTDGGASVEDAGPNAWQLVDDTVADFTLGDFTLGSRTLEDGGVVTLQDGNSVGIFTSRLFELPVDAALNRLLWTPIAPYKKPIPDATSAPDEATAYARDGLDLSELVFLMHADGNNSTPLNDGVQLPESTGRGHPIQLVDLGDTGDTVYVQGVFGTALFLPRTDYLRLTDSDTHSDFAFTDGAYSWSGWAKIDGCEPSESNVILLGGEDPHNWFGADCPEGTAFAYVRDDQGTGTAVRSTKNIVDNNWHHLAIVKHATPNVAILYVDGTEVSRVDDVAWTSFGNFTDELFIGNFPIGTAPDYSYKSELTVDEIAVFHRALSEAEVHALWARGAQELRLQVRVCPAAGCDGVAFIGPDGSATTFFSEPLEAATTTSPPEHVFGAAPSGRKFQYRLYLDTNAPTLAPALDRVELSVAVP
jgi:hypothetical protein